jgi:uncharacterized protein (UPF0276 family)
MGMPDLGVGVGLRPHYYPDVFDDAGLAPRRGESGIDWFEIISENFMVAGGMPLHNLARAMDRFRLVPHGVSLSIGGTDPLDKDYLTRLKELVRRVEAPWVSDHLCWALAGGVHMHDLLPLPYNEPTVRWVAERVRAVQDALGVRFALENVSSYMTYAASEMTEWEFVTAVAEEADCALLLDVNNVFVSAYNHGFDPDAYVDGVPHDRVVQIHLAGHTHRGTHILDTHDDHVVDGVWELYRRALRRTGPVSTLIEWDDNFPAFAVLVAEADKARAIRREVLGAGAP